MVDGSDCVDIDEGFQMLRRGAMVGINHTNNTETCIFDQPLVRVGKTVSDDGPCGSDHGEMIW